MTAIQGSNGLTPTIDSSRFAWLDTALSPDRRAELVVAAMTLEERLDFVHGQFAAAVPEDARHPDLVVGAGFVRGIARLGIPSLTETDGVVGIGNAGNMRDGDFATALPSVTAVAAGWDRDLCYDAYAMVAKEARAKGFNVLLAPSVNIVREPRFGRQFEQFGEDPLLTGLLSVSAIRAIQEQGVISTLKHLILYTQERGVNVYNATIDENILRETDLLPFRIAIEDANPGSLMFGYNWVNGKPSGECAWLLTDIVKTEWNWPGWIMSDWGALTSTVTAANAGVDQQSGEQLDKALYFGEPLAAAVAAGDVTVDRLNDMVHRILRSMFAIGLIDDPVSPGGAIDFEANAAVSQRVAEQSLVLLKNTGDLLPLSVDIRRVAVIGAHANIGTVFGGGSQYVQVDGGAKLVITPSGTDDEQRLKKRYSGTSPLQALREAAPDITFLFDEGDDADAAAAIAKSCDAAILFAEQWLSENFDAASLNLTGGQDDLIFKVAAAQPHTAVVLITAGPVLMPWVGQVASVIAAWYPGQSGGRSVARLLTGQIEPGGRLPISFPASELQLPNQILPGAEAPPPSEETLRDYGPWSACEPFTVTYPEGANVGYRWYEKNGAIPLFPFGHGLTYTRFDYEEPEMSSVADVHTVSLTIINSGDRAGVAVPQIYASAGDPKQLVGWARVPLEPGEASRIDVTLDIRPLVRFDSGARGSRPPRGVYDIMVGESAIDIRLRGQIEFNSVQPS